jgi:hypothetical protein
MLLAEDALTISGIVIGVGLWFGLVYAVYRWGPFEEDRSIAALVKAAVARERDRRRPDLDGDDG